jgi:flagellar hook-length control protein FliK
MGRPAGGIAETAMAAPTASSAASAPAPTPAAASPAGPAPTVATQLLPHVAPLRRGPDGVHRLTVNLRPVELGPVQVLVEVREGVLHLEFTGASELSREALRAALPDLRRELTDAGVAAGTLDVRSDAARPDGSRPHGSGDPATGRGSSSDRRSAVPETDRATTDEPSAQQPSTSAIARTAGLDVRV